MMKFFNIQILLLLLSHVSHAQDNKDNSFFSTKYAGAQAIIQYHFAETKSADKVNVILYRGNEKNEKVKAIHQLNNLPVKSDYYFIDSLLPAKNIYTYTIEIVSNDQVVGRESSKLYAFPADMSASISSFTASAKKNSNEVNIGWKISNAVLAGKITVLRSRKADDDFVPIASLDNTATTFTDQVNDANEPFFYILQINDLRQTDVILSPAVSVVADFEIKPDAPKNLKAVLVDGRAGISWRSEDPLSRGFYVYKRTANNTEFFQASSFIEQNERGIYKWIDTAKTKTGGFAQYIVYAESNSYTKSIASDTVIVELPREAVVPGVPFDLHFIMNDEMPKQLAWSIDSAYADDITGYAVYQKKKNEREYLLLKEITDDQNFIELINPENGTSFIVKSKAGERMSDAGNDLVWNNTASNDFGPKYIKAEIIDDVLMVSWQKSDEQIREYRLYKWDGRNYKADQSISGGNNSVAVRSYKAGESNKFILKAVNAKGEENEGTKAITVY